jgi:hypothetical protein
MALAKTDESALIISVTEAIQNGAANPFGLELPKDWGVSTFSLLSEQAQKHFKRVLDDGGLSTFLLHELNIAYREAGTALPSEGKISDLDIFSDPLATAKRVVAALDALPRQYRILVRGPAELADRIDRKDVNFKLSDQLRLISGALAAEDFKLVHENDVTDSFIRQSEQNGPKAGSFQENSLYFEYRTSGCISRTSNTRIVRDLFDAVRSFYGAAMALGIISDFDYKKANITPWVAADEVKGKEHALVFVSRADDDVIRATNIATTTEYDQIIHDSQETLEESLSPIQDMFSSKDGAKLVTAAIWIFRANISARPMDTILESTIAIEVLLGDRETSDRIGLSKLMANRCAYSLGGNLKERKEIVDFFVEFYKLRSDIVHNGRFKLEEDDGKVVDKGLGLAERILRHEIGLLK